MNYFFLLFFILIGSSYPQSVYLPEFGDRINMGEIENDKIDEASGLAASIRNRGVFWTHNDSGNENRIFALDSNGNNLAEYFLDGITNRDWEDITLGPGPDDIKFYLYIGDIGDNDSKYPVKYIYRIEEPNINVGQQPVVEIISDIDIISFSYPDSERDAETLMIDPLTRDLFIIGKRDSNVRLYRLAYPQSTENKIEAELSKKLSFPNDPEVNTPFNYLTSGDISLDGTEIILKSYSNIYYWFRNAGETISSVLSSNDPIILPFVNSFDEVQSEAICWKTYGDRGYFTLSEEKINYNGTEFNFPAKLYYYPRTSPITKAENVKLENEFELYQNYPNPFNPTTKIYYTLPNVASDFSLSKVRLTIHDILGQEIRTIVDQSQKPGNYNIQFDGSQFASGIYYLRLQFANNVRVRKMLLLK
jgi:hypothetical protein